MRDGSGQDEKLRKRIAGFFHAGENGQRTRVFEPEVGTLTSAARKLDEMLAQAAAEEQSRREAAHAEEVRSLRAAAGRLERMLNVVNAKKAGKRRNPGT